MAKRLVHALALASLVATGAAAQQPAGQTPAPQPPRPGAPEQTAARPPETGQPVNVKVELTITEEMGTTAPAKKLVSLMVADRTNSYVRSGGDVRVGDTGKYRSVNINVDARPTIMREGLVRLDVTLEYRPQSTGTPSGEPALWSISERVGVILESGKPLIISQAFDPTSDRRMTVELKATILK